jgi:hypothetical protein
MLGFVGRLLKIGIVQHQAFYRIIIVVCAFPYFAKQHFIAFRNYRTPVDAEIVFKTVKGVFMRFNGFAYLVMGIVINIGNGIDGKQQQAQKQIPFPKSGLGHLLLA